MKLSRWFIYFVIILSIGINLEYLFSQSILLDEAQSIWVAVKSVPTLLYIDAQDVQVPLYTLLLHFWLQLFGTDIFIARILSVIFFLLTLPVLHRMIRESIGYDVAMLGVGLFSISPFILWYSSEARTYSLLALLASANHLFYLRLFRTGGRDSPAGYFLTALAGVYSHYFFLFLIGAQFIYTLFVSFTRSNALLHEEQGVSEGTEPEAAPTASERVKGWWQYVFSSEYSWFFGKIVGSLILVGILFVPWGLYVYSLGLASNTQPQLTTPTGYNLLQLFVNFLIGFQSINFQSLFIALWPISIMVLFLVFTDKIRLRLPNFGYFMTVTFLPIITIFIISFVKPIFLPRYLIFTTPTLFTLVAWALANYGRKLFSVLTSTLLLCMFAFLVYQDWSQTTPVKENYRDVVDYISANATAHDIVAVSPPFTVYPIEYYYTGPARIDSIPQWNRYVQGAIPKYTPQTFQAQITAYQKVYGRLFVILSYDQGYQQAVQDYLDRHLQLLSSYTYAANIQLRVYRLRYDINAPIPPPPAATVSTNIDTWRQIALRFLFK